MICAIALVLLLDSSTSISDQEWRLQLEGHAAALEAPEVTRVIQRDGMAITAFAFAQAVQGITAWRVVRSAADAREVAAELRTAPRVLDGGTDIAQGMRVSISALGNAPCGDEQVLDIVTDGGADPASTERARDEAHERGIRVNALGVGAPTAAEWLRAHAITPNGFAMAVSDWGEFAQAIRRKISFEISAR